MTSILFVCHGNICRSTMAQYVMEHLVREAGLESRFEIDSAGVSREEFGNPVHRGTRRKLQEVGIRCGDHRARQLSRADYDRFDLIVGMESFNLSGMRRILGGDPEGKFHLLLDFSDRPRDISDPWYTGDFGSTYRDVREGCDALFAYLTGESAPLH